MKTDFYQSKEWLALRYQVLKHYGAKCQCCGRSGQDVEIHVDHIKPRSTHPELELEFTNCQPFCRECNKGKSNVDATDWRPPSIKPTLNPAKLLALIAKIG